ncbi:MAG: hypothetical protein COV36_05135 [Alphaproteobacteria bacterium CG11_big_fil_rev_8_21_14_0_20_44_7]|nr:MAG: hypothetical protein COV36_05135 [Alphaproteobacteria bacterium CG11_big_fil_rev_8_21_14_0_20_44_7]
MNIVGHEEAWKILCSADKNRAHSFLLEGKRGIGKSGLAMKFAEETLGNKERVRQGSHSDFLLVERKFDEKSGKKKRDILVDDARKVANFLSLTPAESDYRVVIIDSADELNNQAANSVLKIVEEPPKRSIVILLSHGGHVLPTIRSRCVSIRLKALGDKEMESILSNILDASTSDIELLKLVAEGSPGIARNIYDGDGLWILHELVEIIDGFPEFNYPRTNKFAERIVKNEEGWRIFNYIFDWVLTKSAKSAATGKALSLDGYDLTRNLSNLAKLLSFEGEWRNVSRETSVFNLDNKQVIVNILHKLSECYR